MTAANYMTAAVDRVYKNQIRLNYKLLNSSC